MHLATCILLRSPNDADVLRVTVAAAAPTPTWSAAAPAAAAARGADHYCGCYGCRCCAFLPRLLARLPLLLPQRCCRQCYCSCSGAAAVTAGAAATDGTPLRAGAARPVRWGGPRGVGTAAVLCKSPTLLRRHARCMRRSEELAHLSFRVRGSASSFKQYTRSSHQTSER